VITCTAPPRIWRRWAVETSDLSGNWYRGQCHLFLDERCTGDGEVQVFRHDRKMVSDARVARAEVLAEDTGKPLTPAQLDERIWARGAEVGRRGRRSTMKQ
jgi:hypothetical protein